MLQPHTISLSLLRIDIQLISVFLSSAVYGLIFTPTSLNNHPHYRPSSSALSFSDGDCLKKMDNELVVMTAWGSWHVVGNLLGLLRTLHLQPFIDVNTQNTHPIYAYADSWGQPRRVEQRRCQSTVVESGSISNLSSATSLQDVSNQHSTVIGQGCVGELRIGTVSFTYHSSPCSENQHSISDTFFFLGSNTDPWY